MIFRLGVAEPLPRCLGLNPQAERAKGAKSTLKLSALQGALLFQLDGACPELVLSGVEGQSVL